MKLLGVTGWKNMGKTTLTERLISFYSAQGLTLSTIKHTHHGVDLDRPGTDSHRHRAAGAGQVVLASRARVAVMTELGDAPEREVADILAALAPCDLVLVEGFKNTPHPKIEVFRANAAQANLPLAAEYPSIRAIAGDVGAWETALPVMPLDDIPALAALGLEIAEPVP